MRYAIAFIRSLFHAIFVPFYTITHAVVILAFSPFASSRLLYELARNWCCLVIDTAMLFCGVRYQVEGMENVPIGIGQKTILLSKHQSTMETFLLPKIMQQQLAFVFKKELLKIPFFGWAMGRLEMVHIDRSDKSTAFAKVVEQGKRILDKGILVIMFPEGTRIARGQVGSYKLGGARLAIATGACVVPIALATGKYWPKKGFSKFSGVAKVSIGKPISSEGKTPEALMLEVQTWIENEMRRLDPDAYKVHSNK